MIKLIAQINPRAGKEKVVYDKLNEVFNYPIIIKIEQLSDYYIILNFNGESVEKMCEIQDADGVLDIRLTPANVVVTNNIDIAENEGHYMVLIKTESGKREQTMKALISSDKLKIFNAAYFFDDMADILLELVTTVEPSIFINEIRGTNGVIDTVLYNLPYLKATK